MSNRWIVASLHTSFPMSVPPLFPPSFQSRLTLPPSLPSPFAPPIRPCPPLLTCIYLCGWWWPQKALANVSSAAASSSLQPLMMRKPLLRHWRLQSADPASHCDEADSPRVSHPAGKMKWRQCVSNALYKKTLWALFWVVFFSSVSLCGLYVSYPVLFSVCFSINYRWHCWWAWGIRICSKRDSSPVVFISSFTEKMHWELCRRLKIYHTSKLNQLNIAHRFQSFAHLICCCLKSRPYA